MEIAYLVIKLIIPMNLQRNKNWNEQLVTEEIRAWQEAGQTALFPLHAPELPGTPGRWHPLLRHLARRHRGRRHPLRFRPQIPRLVQGTDHRDHPAPGKRRRRSLLPLHDAQQVRADGLRLDPPEPLRLVEGRPDRRRLWPPRKSTVTAPGTTIRSSPKSAASRTKAPISAPRRWTRPPTRSSPPPAAVSATGVPPSNAPGSTTAPSAAAAAGRASWSCRKSASCAAAGADLRSGEIRHQHPGALRRRLQGPLLRKLDQGPASRR